MTELERQLTEALKRLSAQSETERRRQSEQVEALRQRVERLSAENDTLRRQIERLDGQVTRLAEYYGTSAVARLLDSNPLRGLKLPKEKNPTRIVLSDEEYDAMLQVSRRVDWRFHVALVLAHETGHRIGAIRHLSWSDVDFEDRTILWRAEHEKSGYEHRTPVTAEALAALEEAQRRNPGNGDAPVLPASRDASRCAGRSPVRYWWNRAEELAGLGRKRGRGWHSLRRKFASDLMDLPLKVLCELGGWKEAQTVLRCYQQADTVQLRKALESRPRVRT